MQLKRKYLLTEGVKIFLFLCKILMVLIAFLFPTVANFAAMKHFCETRLKRYKLAANGNNNPEKT